METLQEAVDYLKIHGKEIGQKGSEGNLLCLNIMKLFQMAYNCPCNGSIGLLLSSIEEYEKVKYTL